jgi:hypothetical protein
VITNKGIGWTVLNFFTALHLHPYAAEGRPYPFEEKFIDHIDDAHACAVISDQE